MKQEFKSSIGGDVAGGNIIHQASSAGAVLNTEASVVNIHVAAHQVLPSSDRDISSLVGRLLKACIEPAFRAAMEQISLSVFGTSTFRNLGAEELKKLIGIANEMGPLLAGRALGPQASRAADDAIVINKRSALQILGAAALVVAISIGVGAQIGYLPILGKAMKGAVTVCVLDGKLYAVGAIIEGRPDQECVLASDGQAEWANLTKAKRKAMFRS